MLSFKDVQYFQYIYFPINLSYFENFHKKQHNLSSFLYVINNNISERKPFSKWNNYLRS